jgi:DNA-binding beta-propeller fold protein YncE
VRGHTDPTTTAARAVTAIALPGAPPDGVFMDYLAYERVGSRVWVPAGNTGSVDVIDVRSGQIARIEGFATAEMERHGTKRIVGPSSATVGDGVVYVGNRGDSRVCAVDAESLQVGSCATLSAMPDGLAYVGATKEVWATTPREHSIAILDAANGAVTPEAIIHLDGQPEGVAVDDQRGLFYTNLEDGDRTLAIDVRSRQVISTWPAGCGEVGPRGLALDGERNFLLVACPDRVRVVDVGHAAQLLDTIDVGDGVDNIDYVQRRHELYAAAARAATLTVARLDNAGRLTRLSVVPTISGARNAVVTDEGTAYLTDSTGGRVLVVAPTADR